MDSICFDRFYAPVRPEWTTGLRRAEICGIRWLSLDLDDGVLSVHQGRVVVAGRTQDAEAKSENSVHLIALDTETVYELRSWKAVQDPNARSTVTTSATPSWSSPTKTAAPYTPIQSGNDSSASQPAPGYQKSASTISGTPTPPRH